MAKLKEKKAEDVTAETFEVEMVGGSIHKATLVEGQVMICGSPAIKMPCGKYDFTV